MSTTANAPNKNDSAFQSIFEASPDAMWIFDESTLQFLEVNSAAQKVYGYSREEFLAMTVKEIRPAKDVPAMTASIGADGEAGGRVWSHLRKDGQELEVTIFSTPTTFDGRRARAVTVRDVTEQARSRRELSATNRTLLSILSASPACILSVDCDGRVQTWNPATEKLVGASLSGAKGQHLWLALGLDEVAAKTLLAGVVGGQTIDRVGIRFTRTGGDRHLSLSAAPIFAEDGSVSGAITILVDDSEAERAREDLEAWSELLERRVSERTSELQAANEELEGFCASVSHDLRSPLRAIDGFSRAILEDYGDRLDDQGRDFLTRVRTATWRMSALIDDLLGLTRLTRATLDRKLVDLARLAREVEGDYFQAAGQREVIFECLDSAVVYGDNRLLRMLLAALMDNCWKFTRSVPEAHVRFEIEKQGDETTYMIADNGVGFDMTFVDKLFRPFERLHRSSEYPGNGIGLATAHRIVTKHGGRIWIESTPGEGTTVRFTLDSLGAAE